MIAYIILGIAVAALFYTMIGYPLLLAMPRRRTRPPVAKDPAYQPTVSVIVAVYNGEKFIREKLDTLLSLDYPKERMEILIVSDGSTDRTDVIVEEYAHRGVQLFHANRGGKAQAVNIGLQVATGEIVFFTDVRQPLDPQALKHLAANFADPTVGAVTGELHYLNPSSGEQADMDLYWRYEIWARKRQSKIDSIFNTTGCIYCARRELVQPLPVDTLTDDAAIPLRVFFQGYRVILDSEAAAFDYPAVAGTEFSRRMRTLAGLWQVHIRLPELFSSRNRMRWHFLSHKFGRLTMPWAIVAVIGATAALPESGFKTFLLIDEAALFAMATLDRFVPRWFPLKRLFSAARTFLVMNAASLAAASVFVIKPQTLWKRTQVTTTAQSTTLPESTH